MTIVRFLLLPFLIPLVTVAGEFQCSATLKLRPDILLHLRASIFDASRHKITKFEAGPVRLIDGKQFFGTDGGVPRTRLDSAAIVIGETKVTLDVSRMFNPWGNAPSPEHFTLTPYEEGWLLAGLFSDAGGAYVAVWRILNGTSIREILTDDEDIISRLFP